MMKLINDNTFICGYNMNKRGKTKSRTEVKSGESSVTTKNVDQETADRIAAAEAMSCLSSLVFLPSNSAELNSIDYDAKQEITDTVNDARAQDMKRKSPKRGKSRNRGRAIKNETAGRAAHVNAGVNATSNDSLVVVTKGTTKKSTQSRKGKARGANKNTTDNNKTVPFTSQHIMNNATICNTGSVQQNTQNVRENTVIINSLSNNHVRESLQQMLESRRQTGESTSMPVTNSVLKLPLAVEKIQIRETVSPKSVASNDSVELTQSTVDSIFSSNKYDTPETSLPLKKRRLLASHQDPPVVESGGEEKKVIMASAATEPKRFKKEADDDVVEVKPPDGAVRVDPRTSLMLLMEVQVAIEPDEDGDLPLHIAVVHENIVMVQKFVHLMTISGKSVDKYNKSQQTPLHLAIELQFEQAVSVLLLAGANPNLVNRHGENAVHMAVKCDAGSCVQLMLNKSQHKIDLNSRNVEGLTPLHVAVSRKQIEIVKLLIQRGADINIQDGKSGRTPLFHAVEANSIPMVDLFQQCGANIDLTNYAGITAVMVAQARGYQEAATILLRGLDTKSYMEHKEKEKLLMPSKKIPIPRIPSKSHLIITPQNNRLTKLDHSSDSNDSITNSHSSEINSQTQTAIIPQGDSEVENTNQVIVQQKAEMKKENLLLNKKNSHVTKTASATVGSGAYYSVSSKATVPSTSSRGSSQATLGKLTNINVSTASLLAAHLQKLLAKGNSAGSAPLNLTTKKETNTSVSSTKEG